jgi:hypothetical protein
MKSEKIIKPGNGYFFLALIFLIMVVIAPNSSKVFLLFGAYRGSARESGLFWVNPLYTRMTLSLKVRNFESEKIKEVNRTLEKEIMERLVIAGIEVVEARIAHLAYAPEIASSMLKRQQASAGHGQQPDGGVMWGQGYAAGALYGDLKPVNNG